MLSSGQGHSLEKASTGKPPLQYTSLGDPETFSSSVSSTTKTAVLENNPPHLSPQVTQLE